MAREHLKEKVGNSKAHLEQGAGGVFVCVTVYDSLRKCSYVLCLPDKEVSHPQNTLRHTHSEALKQACKHTPTHTHTQYSLIYTQAYTSSSRPVCTGADHMLIISSAEAGAAVCSAIRLMMLLQTFITCTHYTHTESFAFEELCDFLINFSKRNESLNRVLWLC